MGSSQMAVICWGEWLWRVNIMKGTPMPQASASAASSHHRAWAMGTMAVPKAGMPNRTAPLMMVARPMGMQPSDMDMLECARMRLAPEKWVIQRVA